MPESLSTLSPDSASRLESAVKHGQTSGKHPRRVTGVYFILIKSHRFSQTAMDPAMQGTMVDPSGRAAGAPRGDGTTPDKYVFKCRSNVEA